MTDRTYCYPPDFTVLRNKLGLRDAEALDQAERLLVSQRIQEPLPRGRFDLNHLRAIHHHLFQDIYEWAGELRTLEISKGATQFQPKRFIETGIADVHRRIIERDFLVGLSRTEFAEDAGQIIGDINHAHPFREGNGRTQLLYLKHLAENAGHRIVFARIDADRWIEASKRSHLADYDGMISVIFKALSD